MSCEADDSTYEFEVSVNPNYIYDPDTRSWAMRCKSNTARKVYEDYCSTIPTLSTDPVCKALYPMTSGELVTNPTTANMYRKVCSGSDDPLCACINPKLTQALASSNELAQIDKLIDDLSKGTSRLVTDIRDPYFASQYDELRKSQLRQMKAIRDQVSNAIKNNAKCFVPDCIQYTKPTLDPPSCKVSIVNNTCLQTAYNDISASESIVGKPIITQVCGISEGQVSQATSSGGANSIETLFRITEVDLEARIRDAKQTLKHDVLGMESSLSSIVTYMVNKAMTLDTIIGIRKSDLKESIRLEDVRFNPTSGSQVTAYLNRMGTILGRFANDINDYTIRTLDPMIAKVQSNLRDRQIRYRELYDPYNGTQTKLYQTAVERILNPMVSKDGYIGTLLNYITTSIATSTTTRNSLQDKVDRITTSITAMSQAINTSIDQFYGKMKDTINRRVQTTINTYQVTNAKLTARLESLGRSITDRTQGIHRQYEEYINSIIHMIPSGNMLGTLMNRKLRLSTTIQNIDSYISNTDLLVDASLQQLRNTIDEVRVSKSPYGYTSILSLLNLRIRRQSLQNTLLIMNSRISTYTNSIIDKVSSTYDIISRYTTSIEQDIKVHRMNKDQLDPTYLNQRITSIGTAISTILNLIPTTFGTYIRDIDTRIRDMQKGVSRYTDITTNASRYDVANTRTLQNIISSILSNLSDAGTSIQRTILAKRNNLDTYDMLVNRNVGFDEEFKESIRLRAQAILTAIARVRGFTDAETKVLDKIILKLKLSYTKLLQLLIDIDIAGVDYDIVERVGAIVRAIPSDTYTQLGMDVQRIKDTLSNTIQGLIGQYKADRTTFNNDRRIGRESIDTAFRMISERVASNISSMGKYNPGVVRVGAKVQLDPGVEKMLRTYINLIPEIPTYYFISNDLPHINTVCSDPNFAKFPTCTISSTSTKGIPDGCTLLRNLMDDPKCISIRDDTSSPIWKSICEVYPASGTEAMRSFWEQKCSRGNVEPTTSNVGIWVAIGISILVVLSITTVLVLRKRR